MSDARALKITTPSDREVVLTRAFAAPRQMVFDALTRPELLKRWLAWLDWDAGETFVTTSLVEHESTTTLSTTVLYASQEVRDAVMKAGIERGSGESYDRLAELLASTSGVVSSTV